MSTNTTHSKKCIGGRPKYILLAVDGAGCDWLWRSTDDAVFVIDEADCLERLHIPADRTAADLVATIASERGTIRKYLVESTGEAFAEAFRA